MRLYNSLTRQVEEFRPADPSRVTFYSCGPTVYDDAHVGNFRSFLAADTLRRWIESPLCDIGGHKGPRQVVHVMNITDVGHMTDDDEGGEAGEDRMAVAGRRHAEAKKSGQLPPDAKIDPADPYAIAEFYAQRFLDDARRLGLKVAIEAQKDATLMPRPTQKIRLMIEMIGRLIAKGHAYAVGPAGKQVVYFDVQSFPAYGRLSGNTLEKLRTGAGGRVSEVNQDQKKHPADFLLWKEDPSHIMKWESPWGAGYPGWHIECTVMSAARLATHGAATQLDGLSIPNAQPIIDLHSGGEDNIFPHHECEIAQSCCAFNASHSGPFAGMWFHPRFLFVEGAKMSKSKGNFFTARDLFAKGYEPGALRLELVKTHYRSNANFTEQGLKDSQRTIDRWRRFVDSTPAAGEGDRAAREECRRAVSEAFMDDLNIAGAMGALNAWMGGVSNPAAADIALVREIDGVFGVLNLERKAEATTAIGVWIGCDVDAAVEAKLAERVEAKKAKDFARSDAIRDELAKRGYAIKDVAGGKVEVRKA